LWYPLSPINYSEATQLNGKYRYSQTGTKRSQKRWPDKTGDYLIEVTA